jgi:glucose-1-phosphate thymidylyltransferase
MENMRAKGVQLVPGKVIEWLDCGNYKATVHTNARVVDFIKDEISIPASATITDSTIIQPCYIGKNVKITGSVVGPNTTISDNSEVVSSIIKGSIVYENTKIENAVFEGAMVGNFVSYKGTAIEASIGDYTIVG